MELLTAPPPGVFGPASARFSVRLPAPPSQDTMPVYRLRFAFERVPPTELRAGRCTPLVREDLTSWILRLDEDTLDPEDGEAKERTVTVHWFAPPTGARLVEVTELSAPPRKGEFSPITSFAAIVKAMKPCDLCALFWLHLDLLTSFEEVYQDPDAFRAGLDAQVSGLAPIGASELSGLNVPLLAELGSSLEVRWRQRAVCFASGQDPRLHVPWLGGFHEVAERVTRLLLALVRHYFPLPAAPGPWKPASNPASGAAAVATASAIAAAAASTLASVAPPMGTGRGARATAADSDAARAAAAAAASASASAPGFDLRAFWDCALRFASGAIAIPQPGGAAVDQLNLQPNSLAIASMAEVVDLALDPMATRLTGKDLGDAALLRAIFASMLEPYFEQYVSRSDPLPRTAHSYSLRNRVPGAPAPNLAGVRDRFAAWSIPVLDPDREAWLLREWGALLAQGLRDEPKVREAMAARG